MRSFKADQVRQHVLDHLASGQFKPGEQLPSEAALAERWGMNHRTVRKGLERLVAEGLIIKQPRVGNFVRMEAAPRFATGVGIILPRYVLRLTSHSPAGIFLEGMSRHLPADQFNLQVLGYDRGQLWNQAGSLAVQRGLKAVLVQPEFQASIEDIDRIHAAGLKVVLHEPPPFLLDHGLPWIAIDQTGPVLQMLERLWEQGHRRFAIYDYQFSSYRAQREAAIRKWLGERQLGEPEVTLQFMANEDLVMLAEWASAVVEKLCARLLQPEPPTAVLAPDETFAHVMIGHCMRHGFQIPEHFSLALMQGYARNLNPIPLTSPDSSALLGQLAERAGHMIEQELLEKTRSPQGITLPATVEWTSSIASTLNSKAKRGHLSKKRAAHPPLSHSS